MDISTVRLKYLQHVYLFRYTFLTLEHLISAYACPPDSQVSNTLDLYNSDTESFEEITESDLAELQAHKSPVSEASDTLTCGSLNSNMDELNDKDVTSAEIEKSQKYMADIVHKYVLGRDYLGSLFSSSYNNFWGNKGGMFGCLL